MAKKKPLRKAYRIPSVLSDGTGTYISGVIDRARKRATEEQIIAKVGEPVWCVFSDTPKGEVNPGTIFRIEIDAAGTTYTVMIDGSSDCEVFWQEEFGTTIFKEVPND